jgi:hypothetical protein
MRAERRLGEIIKSAKATGQPSVGQPPKNGTATEPFFGMRLADVDIDKKLSSREQKLTAVPAAKFEGMIGEWRGRVEKENERFTNKKNETTWLCCRVSQCPCTSFPWL